jgi:hypothetical protein
MSSFEFSFLTFQIYFEFRISTFAREARNPKAAYCFAGQHINLCTFICAIGPSFSPAPAARSRCIYRSYRSGASGATAYIELETRILARFACSTSVEQVERVTQRKSGLLTGNRLPADGQDLFDTLAVLFRRGVRAVAGDQGAVVDGLS